MKIKERTRYDLRSSKELLLEPPLVKTKKILGDKSFQVAAPQGVRSGPFTLNDSLLMTRLKSSQVKHRCLSLQKILSAFI